MAAVPEVAVAAVSVGVLVVVGISAALLVVHRGWLRRALLTLEDPGFCGKGEAGRFVQEHDLTYKGDFPMNTHGGQLSFGQAGIAGGMSHVTEAVLQLTGRAGERQLRRCDTAFVNGNGGIMSEQVSLILRGA